MVGRRKNIWVLESS